MNILRSKEYIEAWSAFALIKAGVIAEPFSKEWLSDRPDLQIGDFGIEVVNAVAPLAGEQRSFQQQLTNCKTFDEANKLSMTDYFKKSQVKVKPLGETDLHFIYTSSLKSGRTDET